MNKSDTGVTGITGGTESKLNPGGEIELGEVVEAGATSVIPTGTATFVRDPSETEIYFQTQKSTQTLTVVANKIATEGQAIQLAGYIFGPTSYIANRLLTRDRMNDLGVRFTTQTDNPSTSQMPSLVIIPNNRCILQSDLNNKWTRPTKLHVGYRFEKSTSSAQARVSANVVYDIPAGSTTGAVYDTPGNTISFMKLNFNNSTPTKIKIWYSRSKDSTFVTDKIIENAVVMYDTITVYAGSTSFKVPTINDIPNGFSYYGSSDDAYIWGYIKDASS